MRQFNNVSSRLLGLFTAVTLFACGGPAVDEPGIGPKPSDSGETPPLTLAPASKEKEAMDLRVHFESQGGNPSLVAASYSTSFTNSATVNTANISFNLYAGDSLTVGTCGVNGAWGSGDTYLRLYDPYGMQVAFNDNNCGGALSNLSYIAPVTGTYVLRAGCFGNNSCSGTVGYSVGGALFSYSATATNSATVNSADVYLNLGAGQVITLGTCGVNGAWGSGDTYMRFYDPSGVQVAYSDDAGGACGVLSNFTYYVPVSGTYLVRSGCFGGGSCNGTVGYLLQ